MPERNTTYLSGNLPDFSASGVTEAIPVTLLMGGNTMLDELYYPDAQGVVTVKIKNLVHSLLAVSYPTQNIFNQPDAAASFSLTIGEQTTLFTAVKGGISSTVDNELFLKANFLTWQPEDKKVNPDAAEWLSYYAVDDCVLKMKATYGDPVTIAEIEAGSFLTFNTNFNYLKSLLNNETEVIQVWVEDGSAILLTYRQSYIKDTTYFLYDDVFCFENTLGGIDCMRMTGELNEKDSPEISTALMGETTEEYSIIPKRIFEKSSGYIATEKERLWAREFFLSLNKWHVTPSGPLRIVIDSVDNKTIGSELNTFTFSFCYAKQDMYNYRSRG